MDIKVYEPKKFPCDVCGDEDSRYMAFYDNGDGKLRAMNTCSKECTENMPYKSIPVSTVCDEGYYYCPYETVPETV